MRVNIECHFAVCRVIGQLLLRAKCLYFIFLCVTFIGSLNNHIDVPLLNLLMQIKIPHAQKVPSISLDEVFKQVLLLYVYCKTVTQTYFAVVLFYTSSQSANLLHLHLFIILSATRLYKVCCNYFVVTFPGPVDVTGFVSKDRFNVAGVLYPGNLTSVLSQRLLEYQNLCGIAQCE